MGPLSRALISTTVFDGAPSHQSERAGQRQGELHVISRVIISSREINPGIFAIVEGRVAPPWNAKIVGQIP